MSMATATATAMPTAAVTNRSRIAVSDAAEMKANDTDSRTHVSAHGRGIRLNELTSVGQLSTVILITVILVAAIRRPPPQPPILANTLPDTVVVLPRPSLLPLSTLTDEAAALLSDAEFGLRPVGSVPKIVHFVYGLRVGERIDFTLAEFLAVKSAVDVIGADRVIFWLRTVPSTPWWDRTMELGAMRALSRGLGVGSNLISLQRVRDVITVFNKSVKASAHKADVIRLEALLTFGGIYMDMDCVAIKSFDQLILQPCTMAAEQLYTNTFPHGLGNAFIICHRHSPWLQLWYAAYHKFEQTEWASLSIHLPLKLAQTYPHYINVLPYDAFYRPLYDSYGKNILYVENTYNLSHNYGVHLWSGGRKYRTQDTFEELCALETTYGRIARTILLAGEGNHNVCNGRGID